MWFFCPKGWEKITFCETLAGISTLTQRTPRAAKCTDNVAKSRTNDGGIGKDDGNHFSMSAGM